eukprot:CAMPEP_0167755392 /NCGR_PEP_ID=MMETSP0110_2-20121227/8795_1 /TAXON_ID=629695 /ORGANISM="Gymnochlora sp., Strain CCMP2014" /LENGTH=412 /DNA_ID=CAMNT_0007641367 /DNA_START=28 /DNA_END=1266 /DNA_ORIENTATION=-
MRGFREQNLSRERNEDITAKDDLLRIVDVMQAKLSSVSKVVATATYQSIVESTEKLQILAQKVDSLPVLNPLLFPSPQSELTYGSSEFKSDGFVSRSSSSYSSGNGTAYSLGYSRRKNPFPPPYEKNSPSDRHGFPASTLFGKAYSAVPQSVIPERGLRSPGYSDGYNGSFGKSDLLQDRHRSSSTYRIAAENVRQKGGHPANTARSDYFGSSRDVTDQRKNYFDRGRPQDTVYEGVVKCWYLKNMNGFIICEDPIVEGKDVYTMQKFLRKPLMRLRQGERVKFNMVMHNNRFQAKNVELLEKRKTKTVRGRCIKWNEARKFGFVKSLQFGDANIFCLATEILGIQHGPRRLFEGDHVECEVRLDVKGRAQGLDIRIIDESSNTNSQIGKKEVSEGLIDLTNFNEGKKRMRR